jgi:hypothetical protein
MDFKDKTWDTIWSFFKFNLIIFSFSASKVRFRFWILVQIILRLLTTMIICLTLLLPATVVVFSVLSPEWVRSVINISLTFFCCSWQALSLYFYLHFSLCRPELFHWIIFLNSSIHQMTSGLSVDLDLSEISFYNVNYFQIIFDLIVYHSNYIFLFRIN